MKQIRRCTRILILSFLTVSMFIPIILFSVRLKSITSDGPEVFIEDLSSIKYRTEVHKLHALKQEEDRRLSEPLQVVYKDGDRSSLINYKLSDVNTQSKDSVNGNGSPITFDKTGRQLDAEDDNYRSQQGTSLSTFVNMEESKDADDRHEHNVQFKSRRVVDEKVKQMKDQIVRAKAYLNFAPPNSNSQLVRELKLRLKEVERALGDCTKDSDLSKSAPQRMRSMEASLLKASHLYHDCSAMAVKLRAMTYNAEEQVRTQKNQARYLVQLAGRTTPKGLHCLSMRLTAEYFSLQPEERELPNQHKFLDPDLYHFAVFSDNVLACSVVVNSTISSIMEPEKVVFHVVTDSLNFPAITMWFLLNPPGKTTIQVQSIDTFKWLSSEYGALVEEQSSSDPRYTATLNHLRFYLPDVFPALNKILLLDHDVVVQRDLTGLWNVNMKGKVNGAVETCQESKPSFRRMDMFINFTHPMVSKRFDVKACTWAFGMNIFDLQEWRIRNLTRLYHKYLLMGKKRQLWKAGGSLPIGWVTFYNQTVGLDWKWHVLGLGSSDSGTSQSDIDSAAVIHYDGTMKPWLDIGIEKYRNYWRKHVNYDHPYLLQCNIHQ